MDEWAAVDMKNYPEKIEDCESLLLDMKDMTTLELLHTLTRYGFLRISPENYQIFAALYSSGVQDEHDECNTILTDTPVNKLATLTLIEGEESRGEESRGKESRGTNDYFILKILTRLEEGGVTIKTIPSDSQGQLSQATMMLPAWSAYRRSSAADNAPVEVSSHSAHAHARKRSSLS